MVVLPPPDVPRIVMKSPSFIVRLTPLRAGTPSSPRRYVLWTLISLMTSFEFSSISSAPSSLPASKSGPSSSSYYNSYY